MINAKDDKELQPVAVPAFLVNHYNQLQLENVALKARIAELEEQLYERFDEQADIEAGK